VRAGCVTSRYLLTNCLAERCNVACRLRNSTVAFASEPSPNAAQCLELDSQQQLGFRLDLAIIEVVAAHLDPNGDALVLVEDAGAVGEESVLLQIPRFEDLAAPSIVHLAAKTGVELLAIFELCRLGVAVEKDVGDEGVQAGISGVELHFVAM